MKYPQRNLYVLFVGLLISTLMLAQNYSTLDTLTTDDYIFKVEKTFVNKSMWNIPYRYQQEDLKCLTVKLTVEVTNHKIKTIDPNLLSIVDDQNKLRIRPNGIFYFKKDKRVYLKSKPLNKNYDSFHKYGIKDYTDFEAEIYKTNMLGLRKKKFKESVQQFKELPFKTKKISYYLDFPVKSNFSEGKLYFKDQEIGTE